MNLLDFVSVFDSFRLEAFLDHEYFFLLFDFRYHNEAEIFTFISFLIIVMIFFVRQLILIHRKTLILYNRFKRK